MRLGSELAAQARELVERRLGLRLGEDRQGALNRAVLEGLRSSGRSPETYLAELAAQADDHPEWARLIAVLTIGETYFWRDRACFQALEGHVIPTLIAGRRAQRVLRAWSAACSTGEEAYSVAILLDRLLPDRAAWDLTVLATDLNPAAIEKARRGLFRPWSLRDLPAALRERYFEYRGAKGFELDPEIRRMVRFETANLLTGLPGFRGAAMDLVLCRNALMYLTPDALRESVAHLRAALAEDGWLLVAPAEASSEALQPLIPVNFPGAIFFRRGAKEARPAKAHASAAPKPAARAGRRPPSPRPPAVEAPRPDSANDLKAHARALADRGSLDEALRLCQAVLRADRHDAESYRLLAAIQQERGEAVAALAALRRALYLDPDAVEAHLALGSLLLKRGERTRGHRHLEAAKRLRRKHEETT